MADLALTRHMGAPRPALSWNGLSVSHAAHGRLTLAIGLHRPPLPRRVGEIAAIDGAQVVALAPDRWLAAGEDSFGQAAPALPPDLTLHDVTDAYAGVRIDGPLAEALLGAATGIDLGPDAFPVGQARLTEFAKTRAVLLRQAGDSFDVFFDSSVVESIWEWAAVNGALVASA